MQATPSTTNPHSKGHHVMARRFKASPSVPRVGDLPVFEQTLANGLRALVLPRRQARIVVCDLYYPVGSFDEPNGKSGLARFLERMLFKGTERIPEGQIDQLAFLAGGTGQRGDRRGLHALLVHVPVGSVGAGASDRVSSDEHGPLR
jgi:hypothetical protein